MTIISKYYPPCQIEMTLYVNVFENGHLGTFKIYRYYRTLENT